MIAVVVDTNVLVVANDPSHDAGPDCVIACVDLLEAIRERSIVVLDESRFIWSEYEGYVSYSGQPGIADAFFKWLHDNQPFPDRLQKIDTSD